MLIGLGYSALLFAYPGVSATSSELKTEATAANNSSDIITPTDQNTISDNSIYEEFIGLRINDTRGSSFYRVLINEQEEPYLDVDNILNKWLDIKADCKVQRQYCQGVLQPGDKQIWIDGMQGQMGSPDGEVKPLAGNAFFVKEGKVWLHYDAWSKWLPVSSNWSVQSYSLNLHPQYLLLKELKTKRAKSRALQLLNQEKNKKLHQLPLITPENSVRTEIRYRVKAMINSNEKAELLSDYDLNMDILNGSLQAGGVYNHSAQPQSDINYWRYQQLQQKNFHLFEIGHTNFVSFGLLPSVSVAKGVQFKKNRTRPSAGVFEWYGHTRRGTEIDVYRNGFLEKSILVDSNGDFKIDNLLVSSNDRILLRYFFADGSEDRELIHIAPDDFLLIKAGQWDTSAFIGQTDNGLFAHAKARYGIKPEISAGIHALQLPSSEKDIPGFMTDVSWRIRPDLHGSVELFRSQNSLDYRFSSYNSGFNRQSFEMKYQGFSEFSPLRELKNISRSVLSLFEFTHIYRAARINWVNQYQGNELEKKLSVNIDFRINPRLSLLTNAEYLRPQSNEDNYLLNLGGLYAVNANNRIEVDLTHHSTQADSIALNYRSHAKERKKWDAGFGIKATQEDYSFAGLANWHITKKLSLGVSFSKDSGHFELAWSDIISPKPGSLHWDEFAKGTLHGRILQPQQVGESKPVPLPGVIVSANMTRAMTDKDGYYQISGLTPYQRIFVSVDANSLDASLAPLAEVQAVKFRPGTTLELNPPISWTAGVDGVIYHFEPIPPQAKLKIRKQNSDQTFTDVTVEEDGFFVVEGLTSGTYELRLTNVENPPDVFVFELPEKTDWLSGLQWQW